MNPKYFYIVADAKEGIIDIYGMSAPNEDRMQTVLSKKTIPYSAQNYKEFFSPFYRQEHNRYKMFEVWSPLKLSWLVDYMQGKPVQDI